MGVHIWTVTPQSGSQDTTPVGCPHTHGNVTNCFGRRWRAACTKYQVFYSVWCSKVGVVNPRLSSYWILQTDFPCWEMIIHTGPKSYRVYTYFVIERYSSYCHEVRKWPHRTSGATANFVGVMFTRQHLSTKSHAFTTRKLKKLEESKKIVGKEENTTSQEDNMEIQHSGPSFQGNTTILLGVN